MSDDNLVPAAYPDARVRYPRGAYSEKTGRFAGECVEWSIPTGHEIYDAGSGAGQVLVPNDGGFVWISDGHIVPAEFVRPASGAAYPPSTESAE